jgi:hypothetical protein
MTASLLECEWSKPPTISYFALDLAQWWASVFAIYNLRDSFSISVSQAAEWAVGHRVAIHFTDEAIQARE